MQVEPPKKNYPNKIRNFQSTMKLCDEFGRKIVPNTLEGKLPPEKIIWAIPADQPNTVKYYPWVTGIEYFPCEEEDKLRPNGTPRRTNMIHHDYLVEGKPVLCAGETTFHSGKLALTNKSGHYTPDNDCLLYAKTLFEAKGNPIGALYGMKGGKARKKTRKAKKVLRPIYQ